MTFNADTAAKMINAEFRKHGIKEDIVTIPQLEFAFSMRDAHRGVQITNLSFVNMYCVIPRNRHVILLNIIYKDKVFQYMQYADDHTAICTEDPRSFFSAVVKQYRSTQKTENKMGIATI